MRILSTGDAQAIASELTWLAALRREAGLPVPEPVPTPGLPHGRHVSLMRWVGGRHLNQGLRPHHARAWGRLIARLHEFSAGWQPPQGFNRPHWDWAGQLGGRDFRQPVEELVASMPKPYQEPFQTVSRQARQVMESFGKGPDAYGLIHSDMFLENVLFKAGGPRIIDFKDCGYGYWMGDNGLAWDKPGRSPSHQRHLKSTIWTNLPD